MKLLMLFPTLLISLACHWNTAYAQTARNANKGSAMRERLSGFSNYLIFSAGQPLSIADSVAFYFKTDAQQTLLDEFRMSTYNNYVFFPSATPVMPSLMTQNGEYYLDAPSVEYDSAIYMTMHPGQPFSTTLLERAYTNGKIIAQRETTPYGTSVCTYGYANGALLNQCNYNPLGHPWAHSFSLSREYDNIGRVKRDSSETQHYGPDLTEYTYDTNNNLIESTTRGTGGIVGVRHMSRYTYAYDTNHNVVAKRNYDSASNVHSIDSFTYQNNQLRRINYYYPIDSTLLNWTSEFSTLFHCNNSGLIDSICMVDKLGNSITIDKYYHTSLGHVSRIERFANNVLQSESRYYYQQINNTGVKTTIAPNKFGLFPNPAKDELTLQFFNTFKHRVAVSIYNMQGKRVYTDYSDRTINIATLPMGSYFIEIRENEAVERLRFVKGE